MLSRAQRVFLSWRAAYAFLGRVRRFSGFRQIPRSLLRRSLISLLTGDLPREPAVLIALRPSTHKWVPEVENGVGYIRKNFLCARESDGLTDLQGQMRTWIWQTANQRIHGTTHRQVLEHWQEEKRFLLPLTGKASYPYASQESRQVSRDAFVSYRGNRYSVPWRVAGQEVLVQERDGQLQICRGGERLAVHLLCPSGTHQCVIVAQHHEGIPLGASLRPGKAKIHLLESEGKIPVVEVRSLQSYELEISSERQEISSEQEVTHD